MLGGVCGGGARGRGDGPDAGLEGGGAEGEAARRKLQVLVALCDVDDLATRMAASGAVATLAASPVACASYQQRRGYA